VGGEQISSIGRGLCVLLGISLEDTQRELEHILLSDLEDVTGKHWELSESSLLHSWVHIHCYFLSSFLQFVSPFIYFYFFFGSTFGEHFVMCYPSKSSQHFLSLPFSDGKFGAYMQVHIQNDGPVTIELESPAATVDPKQLMKLEKQQQRKEKTRTKVPSESSRERNAPRNKDDPSASSGAEGDVSSEREP
ncbi:D-tyrosyl-tRNA(Tyr) deacylase 1, partial [Manacus vitellinus]